MTMISLSDFATWARSYPSFPYEIDHHSGQSWLAHNCTRFFEAYRACSPHLAEGARVIDLGAFPGTLLKILRLRHRGELRLVGAGMPVEPSFPADLRALDIDFVPADLDRVPSPHPKRLAVADGSADLVFSMDMIEHLYSLRPMMEEVCRVLKPGGLFYVSTNNVAYLPGVLRLVARSETNLDVPLDATSALVDSEWRGHVRFYSLQQLQQVCRTYGLEVVEARYFHALPSVRDVPPARWMLKRALAAALTLTPRFRSHISVLARKPLDGGSPNAG